MWEIRSWVSKSPLRRKKAPRRHGVVLGKGHPAGAVRASRIARSPGK